MIRDGLLPMATEALDANIVMNGSEKKLLVLIHNSSINLFQNTQVKLKTTTKYRITNKMARKPCPQHHEKIGNAQTSKQFQVK